MKTVYFALFAIMLWAGVVGAEDRTYDWSQDYIYLSPDNDEGICPQCPKVPGPNPYGEGRPAPKPLQWEYKTAPEPHLEEWLNKGWELEKVYTIEIDEYRPGHIEPWYHRHESKAVIRRKKSE